MRTLIALMLFATTPVAAGDYEDGAAAYYAGDYQKAYRLWKRSAEQGHKLTQYLLVLMYVQGEGVPEDPVKAVHWFTKAAKQGDADAQSNLGTMYRTGKGVPEDYVRAYAWFSISAAQGVAGGK